MSGTVRHMDMLVLHENSTLPLSDANSKSVNKFKNLIMVHLHVFIFRAQATPTPPSTVL